MATARREGESFEEYKARRNSETQEHKSRKRTGWWFHKGGTYNRAEEEQKQTINRGLFILTLHVFACILSPIVQQTMEPVAE